MTRRSLPLLLSAFAALLGAPALAQAPAEAADWATVKCERYKAAWAEALRRRGARGLGPEFVSRHDAFLASGCTGPHDVCPRSPEEFDRANLMVILAMNAGTASTFPPFGCPR